jgi:fructokinase
MRIGIDLGGTKIEGVVMADDRTIVARVRQATPAAEGYGAIIDRIAAITHELEAAANAPCTIGVGTPGAISSRTGRMKNCNTTCLNDMPLKADLEQALKREVRLCHWGRGAR